MNARVATRNRRADVSGAAFFTTVALVLDSDLCSSSSVDQALETTYDVNKCTIIYHVILKMYSMLKIDKLIDKWIQHQIIVKKA